MAVSEILPKIELLIYLMFQVKFVQIQLELIGKASVTYDRENLNDNPSSRVGNKIKNKITKNYIKKPPASPRTTKSRTTQPRQYNKIN